jgi:ATP-dependent Lon protease
MFLDELCLAKSDGEWAITPSLLSLFDAEQRKNVKEQFLDLNFDCSGVLFFTTTNNYENLLPALKSRLTNFDIKPPSKMEMKKICQNIYTSYLKEKKFQRHLEEQLSFDVTESLSLLTPREAKNTLISALRKAFVRSADCSELGQVTLQDIAVRKGSDCEPQPVGFIH